MNTHALSPLRLRAPDWLLALACAWMLGAAGGLAAEPDSFTYRQRPLADTTDYLNRIVNDRLRQAAERANNYIGRRRCRERILYKEIRQAIGRRAWRSLESIVANDPNISKHQPPNSDSIFADWTAWESLPLSSGKVGSVVKINNQLVGADKLEQFVEQGWGFFWRAYILKKGELYALDYGMRAEAGLQGYGIGGMYSYADLASTYNGMRFWTQVTGIETGVSDPYFRRVDNQWVLAREFDFRDYVDAAWDEAINCNRYRTPRMTSKVLARIRNTEIFKTTNRACFMEPDMLAELRAKYGRVFRFLINPSCASRRQASCCMRGS